jgi:hypothetical protein
MNGSVAASNSFDKGGTAPNKAAEPSAKGTPGQRWEWESDMIAVYRIDV